MLASGGLREEKIGDVGAGDEKNEKRNDHERGKKNENGVFVARGKRTSLFEAEAEVFVCLRMRCRETLREKIKFGGGFGFCDAAPETRGGLDPVHFAGVKARRVGEKLIHVADGNPELRVENEVDAAEIPGSDADDGIRMSGQHDGFP